MLGNSSSTGRRNVPLGDTDRQHCRISCDRIFWYPHGPGWTHVCRNDDAPIRNSRNLRQLHDVFFIQPANPEADERRRMASCGSEYRTLGYPLPCRGLGRTQHGAGPDGSEDRLTIFASLFSSGSRRWSASQPLSAGSPGSHRSGKLRGAGALLLHQPAIDSGPGARFETYGEGAIAQGRLQTLTQT